MKKKYLLPIVALACILPTTVFAATQNVTINFTLNNITLAEVEQFNTYLSYSDTMNPQTLLTSCTAPAAGSVSPYIITCSNVPIDQYPVYFKVAPVVAGAEIASDRQEVADPNPPTPPPISVVQGFQFEPAAASSPPSEPPTGTVFYWGMETLPTSTTTSDVGNITISKHLNASTSVPGVTGNALDQTGVWQTYKFPMATLPTAKGTISFQLKHIYSSADNNNTSRYFFQSETTGAANSIYAWVSRDDIWFYLYDSNGTQHRIYKQTDTWAADTWYEYEFTWDESTGYMAIKRNGAVVVEANDTPWSTATPNWGNQDFYIGYSYEIGTFDEFYIYQ